MWMNRVVVVDDDAPNLKLYSALVKRVLGEDALAFENPSKRSKAYAICVRR